MLKTFILLSVLSVAFATQKLTDLVIAPETGVAPGTALSTTAGLLVTVKVAVGPSGSGVKIAIPGDFTGVAKGNIKALWLNAAAPAKTNTAAAENIATLLDTDVTASATELAVFLRNGNTALVATDYVGIYVELGTLDAKVCTTAVTATLFTTAGTTHTVSTATTDVVSKTATSTEIAACTQCADAAVATASTAATTGSAITALCFCGNLTTHSTEAPKTCAKGKICAATRADTKTEAVGDTFTCTAKSSGSSSSALSVGVSSSVALLLVYLVRLF